MLAIPPPPASRPRRRGDGAGPAAISSRRSDRRAPPSREPAAAPPVRLGDRAVPKRETRTDACERAKIRASTFRHGPSDVFATKACASRTPRGRASPQIAAQRGARRAARGRRRAGRGFPPPSPNHPRDRAPRRPASPLVLPRHVSAGRSCGPGGATPEAGRGRPPGPSPPGCAVRIGRSRRRAHTAPFGWRLFREGAVRAPGARGGLAFLGSPRPPASERPGASPNRREHVHGKIPRRRPNARAGPRRPVCSRTAGLARSCVPAEGARGTGTRPGRGNGAAQKDGARAARAEGLSGRGASERGPPELFCPPPAHAPCHCVGRCRNAPSSRPSSALALASRPASLARSFVRAHPAPQSRRCTLARDGHHPRTRLRRLDHLRRHAPGARAERGAHDAAFEGRPAPRTLIFFFVSPDPTPPRSPPPPPPPPLPPRSARAALEDRGGGSDRGDWRPRGWPEHHHHGSHQRHRPRDRQGARPPRRQACVRGQGGKGQRGFAEGGPGGGRGGGEGRDAGHAAVRRCATGLAPRGAPRVRASASIASTPLQCLLHSDAGVPQRRERRGAQARDRRGLSRVHRAGGARGLWQRRRWGRRRGGWAGARARLGGGASAPGD